MTEPLRPSVAITEPDRPRAWFGCLSCYNNARLVGHWFDATDAAEVDLAAIHKGSGVAWRRAGCEEILALDLDGRWPISAEIDTVTAARWGELYEEVGAHVWEPFCVWARGESMTDPEDIDVVAFTDRYRGEWESFEDYALDYVESCGMMREWPEEAKSYFDLARYARDLSAGFTVERCSTGGVYVFSDT
ncbi:antirestriction protein ArdA [Gordonia sp. SND2]|uniref:antirestriction protein ArdA n=1 Tax=Gordonia sp. SND2 TaxID=3388659 RepID=UPI00398B82C3